MARQYSLAEWESRKDLIIDLYINQHMKLGQVRAALGRVGFSTSDRALRHKLSQWRVKKKHKASDMRTALHILDRVSRGTPRVWISEPVFLIRGKQVTLGEILRYYRRRDIYDVFGWLATQSSDGFQCSPDVFLISPNEDISDSGANMDGAAPSNILSLSKSTAGLRASLPASIDSPEVYRGSEYLVFLAETYTTTYLQSSRSDTHAEPRIHRNTRHGRFGHKIQDAIASILRESSLPSTFNYINSAFDELGPMLKDEHPMALAQFLAIVCELEANIISASSITTRLPVHYTMQQILALGFRHLKRLSTVFLDENHPLRRLLVVLSNREVVLEESVRIMQKMVEVFDKFEADATKPSHWKLLYLRERFCDCLYHAKYRASGAAARATLLHDQEAYYGQGAPNVLWTLTNVADDQLYNLNYDGAEKLFTEALARAGRLEGFSKAKSRFAALEGSAKASLLRAGLFYDPLNSQRRITHQSRNHRVDHDTKAYLLRTTAQNCETAQTEAIVWFGVDSRRTIRMSQMLSDIDNELKRLRISSEYEKQTVS